METKFYNVRVSYRGEGVFTFTVRGIGEVQIQAGRDLYIVDADVQTIEGLRQLKPAMVDIKIGAKSDGCYKTYDMNRIRPRVEQTSRMNYSGYAKTVEAVSSEDLSSIKKAGQTGPIPMEETITTSSLEESNKVEEAPETVEEVSETVEEVSETVEDVDYGNYVLTSTSHKGKKLKKLSKRQLGGIKKYANEEDLKAIEEFLK